MPAPVWDSRRDPKLPNIVLQGPAEATGAQLGDRAQVGQLGPHGRSRIGARHASSLTQIGLVFDSQSWDSGLHEPHHHCLSRGHSRGIAHRG